MSIRARLLLLVLFATLLSTAVIAYDFLDRRAARISQAQNALSTLAQRAARDLDERILGTAQLLYGLARASDLDTRDRAACSIFLGNVLAEHPQYTGILTIDPDGKLFCDSLRTARDLDLNDRKYFRDVRDGNVTLALQPAVGRLTGISVLQIAHAARRGTADLKFVLLASLNLQTFAQLRARSVLVSGNDFIIVDREGTVLTARAPGGGPSPVGTSIAGTPLHRFAIGARSGDQGEVAGLDGQPWIWGVGTLPGARDAGIYLLAGAPKRNLAEAANKDLRHELAIVSAFALLAFLGAWLLGELGVRRPLARVVAMVNRLSAGDLEARVAPPRPGGEIGELADALNRTAESLDAHARQVDGLNIRLSGLIESSPAAVMCLDRNGCVTLWNPAAERLFGHAADEVLGKRPPNVPAAQWDDCERQLQRALAGGAAEDGQAVCVAKDDTPRTVLYRIAPLPGAGGTISEAIVVFTDVTEKHVLQDRLNQAQKMEAIGQLTGGLAHDFNNLLTVIMGNSEMLAERLSDNGDLRPLAETTLQAATRGADLTRSLLAFARRQALEPKVVDVNALVSGMQGILRRTLGEHVEVQIAATNATWRTSIDPAQLETALLNLAINARDAMPDGGRLLIETADVALDTAYAANNEEVRAGEYAMVAVADTGTGMPPEVIARAFEPFFTTKEVGKGSGLGLSMVYGFVKQSGGHVKIYSELGHGTIVKLYLPRATAKDETERAGRGRAVAEGNGELVLIVEDDDMVRTYVDGQVASLGYRTLAAQDAREALEILRGDTAIDLLFTDVVMPGGMNGGQLAKEAVRLRPGLKVLFTSGYTENVIVHQGRLDGGVQLLNKPYTRADLAAKLRLVLDGPPG